MKNLFNNTVQNAVKNLFKIFIRSFAYAQDDGKRKTMQFGQRFKEVRKQCGYTQKQIADLLKIEQSNISDRENDVSRPEYENLIALAEIYGETLESLLGIEL